MCALAIEGVPYGACVSVAPETVTFWPLAMLMLLMFTSAPEAATVRPDTTFTSAEVVIVAVSADAQAAAAETVCEAELPVNLIVRVFVPPADESAAVADSVNVAQSVPPSPPSQIFSLALLPQVVASAFMRAALAAVE